MECIAPKANHAQRPGVAWQSWSCTLCTGPQKSLVQYGAEWSAAYLSNDDGHTPRAAPYPPFPPFLCPTKAEMMTAVILIVMMRMMLRAMVTLTRVNAKGDHSVRG